MRETTFTVVTNNEIAPDTWEMILHSEEQKAHGIQNPGQFVNIKLDGFFLRRPISVCNWDDDLIIVYKVVGKGTAAMSQYAPGTELDILSPLGNGFDTSKSGDRPLMIGGGAGIPPMYGLCRQLLEEGKQPTIIMGFNTGEEAYYIEDFEQRMGIRTIVTTVDGSLGIKGFVTDALSDLDFTHFYACGPEAMLRALDETIDPAIDGQLSFEERMGCGFGACMGCSCETKYGSKRICKEGPVLERGEIIW